jgi:hypothetical protein
MRQGNRTLGIESEGGAGSSLALLVVISAIGLLSVGSVFASQELEKARLEAATEAIAIASANALIGVNTGFPCIVAKDIAAINQVILERCRIVGFEVFVETSSNEFGFTHRSKSRAGPDEQ